MTTYTKTPLEPYYGEFLISPPPLELTLNYCSHKCLYCFANLAKPDRKSSPKKVMNLLRDMEKRDTTTARLLRERYPVLISNKVDPFAASNYKQALPIARTMTELEIPIAWQTKGGLGLDELLPDLPKACWYVSISFTDDELRKRIEPGAPPIESRYELIAELLERGHSVNVGVNPLVPEWLPEPEPLLDRLKELGVHGVWLQALHFNYLQRDNMTEVERDAIGEELIVRAMKRNGSEEDLQHLQRAEDYGRSIGLETYVLGQPYPSGYFDEYETVYPHIFPTMQGFVNHAFERFAAGDVLTFADWWDYCGPRLPKGVLELDHVIGATACDLWRRKRVPKFMTYRQLLGIIWQEALYQSPARLQCFALLEDEEGNEVVDLEGMRHLVFLGEHRTNSWYVTEQEAETIGA